VSEQSFIYKYYKRKKAKKKYEPIACDATNTYR